MQRAAISAVPVNAVPPIVHEVLNSPGQPLDAGTRAIMEPRFGHDFSQVRVHTDARAAESARAVNALAYTAGRDIVFSAGRYVPHSSEGKRLLAHELTHVIQQPPGIARQEDTTLSDMRGLSSQRAREYQPHLRPHIPTAPRIPPPPTPGEQTLPGVCPDAATVRQEIQRRDIPRQTEAEMHSQINIGRSRSAGQIRQVSPSLIQQADTAIRQEFGSLLPSGRNPISSHAVTVRTPSDFAALRVPDTASALERIGEVALKEAPDDLRDLCIRTPTDNLLQSEVAVPLLNRLGINFVRDYESFRIGGQTSFPAIAGRTVPHVDIPSESRNMGHIIVHELLHYYVHDTYRATARANPPLESQLMEGGAEFLARHVIHQRLSHISAFQINYSTYSGLFSYVSTNLLRGGLGTFALAYFQGRVDLLGLTPVTIQPKLSIGQSYDPYEQEAERMAEQILRTPTSLDS